MGGFISSLIAAQQFDKEGFKGFCFAVPAHGFPPDAELPNPLPPDY